MPVTIVGAGNVGATAAHIIAPEPGRRRAHRRGRGCPGQGARHDAHAQRGEVHRARDRHQRLRRHARPDVVVITAGIARKPGMTCEDLLGVNAGIIVGDRPGQASPNAVFICVTNPLDVMTTLAFRESGLPASASWAWAACWTPRLSFACARSSAASRRPRRGPWARRAWCAGALTTGTPITELMDEAAVAEVVQRCVKGGAEVVAHLKTGSAYYAPGASIAKMVEAILGDTHEIMSVCAHIDGQYGIDDLYMNVPVRLGRGGVEEVVEFDLDDEELAALRASADSVRAGLANLPE
ncbi:MAG: lactate/malate family dehydrogenase [Gordonibacter urolithinfaciens]